MSIDATTTASGTDGDACLAAAEALAEQHRLHEAIALATRANARCRDGRLERRLVQWRHQVFDPIAASRVVPPWPPRFSERFQRTAAPPEIDARDLDAQTLAEGILGHGSLLVRNLIDTTTAQRLVDDIDTVFNDAARHNGTYDEQRATDWYRRLPLPGESLVSNSRDWIESAGGVLLADSPRLAFDYIELLQRLNVIPAIEGYFGERPALSVAKTTLRRVPSTLKLTGWHQDGSFMGTHMRSVNLWLCLSHCGEHASGLDILPKRMEQILETGTQGAWLDWSVGEILVEKVSRDAPVVSPVFRPGDALLFDHMMLHRTGITADMRHDRYAVESWFFAPSIYPMAQEPLVI